VCTHHPLSIVIACVVEVWWLPHMVDLSHFDIVGC
jgi:hypothetical protein